MINNTLLPKWFIVSAFIPNKIRKPKEEFCLINNIKCKSTFSVVLTAYIREKFANFKELYPINQKTAENGFESLTEPIKETVTDQEQNYFSDWSDADETGEQE